MGRKSRDNGESTAALEIAGVRKSYGKQSILRGVDLMLPAGSSLACVGINGAGKTTLMKGILNVLDLDGGTIRIYGRSHSEDVSREPLLFVPERFTPPSFMTGWEFLHHMAGLYGVDAIRERVREHLDGLDLDPDAMNRRVATYSKGMRQKLGLASALVSGRKLLMLDEPMSGLDPRSRVLFKRALNRQRQSGVTLFFNTHMLADVEEVCDTMAILDGGSIRFHGTPSQCRERFGASTLEEAFITCIETGSGDRHQES
ncbi:MAG: ABC transporter ATP-binding protein [Magnetococcales bacterium]|nr:ABC transporter ATP-binding protein [Magnetococcales bacterium]